MKRLSIFILTIIASISCFAQTATSVLDKTASEFKKCPSVTVAYTVAIQGEEDNGTITLQGKKFKNEMSNTSTWFDGKTMWSLVKENEEVNVTNPNANQLAKINPYAFLDIYKKGYNVAFGKNEKDHYEVILTATDSKSSIQKAIIRISRSNYQPLYIMMGGSKAEMEIKIKSYKKGNKLADTAFQFDKKKYPNFDIIDLR